MPEKCRSRFADFLSFGALLFSILGGVGYFLLIRYPDRIDYVQQANFDRISVFTLTSLIIGVLCGIVLLCFSRKNLNCLIKGIFGLCIPLILLVATFSTPRLFVKSVLTAQNICINNTRKIEAVKAEWAQRAGATNGAAVTWDEIAPYFTNGIPKCPEGGTYNLGKVGEPVLCSIPSHRLPSQ
ncbi:MAG: hypothetical protein WAO02_07100 [Verrucomicrobiia bacterium]